MSLIREELYWDDDDCEDITDYEPGGFHPVPWEICFPSCRTRHCQGTGSCTNLVLDHSPRYGLQEIRHSKIVALKVNVASISDNNESRILQWLETQPLTHPGQEHILTLRDSFFIYGPNGKHEALVTDVVLPLDQFDFKNVPKDHSKRICLQCLMGIAYLQEHNVSHGDLHLGNLAICIPSIENQTMDDFMDFFRNPECIPVLTRDPSEDTKSLPKYLVLPISILEICNDILESTPGHAICVKIMDFGNAFRPTDNRPPLCCPLMIRPPEVELNRHLGGIIDDENGLKSDIWSLGCTIYEMFLRHMIFGGLHSGGEAGLIKEMTELCGEPPVRWQRYWETMLSVNDNDSRSHRKRRFLSVPDVSAEFNDG